MKQDELKRFRQLDKEARQLKALLDELSARMTSPGAPQLSAAPRAHTRESRIEENVARYLDTEEKYRAKLAELFALQLEIEEAIDPLDIVERMIIRARYLQHKTMEEIADEIEYSYRQTWRLHDSTIEKLAEQERALQSEKL